MSVVLVLAKDAGWLFNRVWTPYVANTVDAVAEATGMTRMSAVQPVEALLETLSQALARHDRIELRGFGVFEVRRVRTEVGRNPKRPSERFQIPPGFTIRFKAGKDLREALEGRGGCAVM